MADTYTTVSSILTGTFGVPADDLGRDVTFESLGLDSLDLVELTLVIEEETGIKIEDEELEDVRTIGDAADAIDEKQKALA